MLSITKDSLVLNNKNLVYFILKKYNMHHNDDLFQTGMLGLIKAANLYDEKRKFTFSSFAYRCISNEISAYFRKQHSKSFNDYANTISYNTLIDEDNKKYSLEEHLGYTPDFDTRLYYQNLYTIIETTLTTIEKTVITYYFGLYNTTPITQAKLSKILNISQTKISRIIKHVKEKLKDALED